MGLSTIKSPATRGTDAAASIYGSCNHQLKCFLYGLDTTIFLWLRSPIQLTKIGLHWPYIIGKKEINHEAYLPAQQNQTRPDPRIQEENVYQSGPPCDQPPAGEGQKTTVGLIGTSMKTLLRMPGGMFGPGDPTQKGLSR